MLKMINMLAFGNCVYGKSNCCKNYQTYKYI